jgi:Kef-type K+ transport system membrane component KefB
LEFSPEDPKKERKTTTLLVAKTGAVLACWLLLFLLLFFLYLYIPILILGFFLTLFSLYHTRDIIISWKKEREKRRKYEQYREIKGVKK